MQELERLKAEIETLITERKKVKAMEAGYKTTTNGTFGKLFSRFSIFYAPELGIATTIGGQLSLLMLIERLDLSGIRVVSANTDGIEMLVPADREWIANSIIKWWENATGLGMDQEEYKSLYSRDVNNYISVHYDGTTKRKGAYRESGLIENKHPDCDICADAVVAYLVQGIPIETTIRQCQDVRKFVRIRGVTSGGIFVGPGAHVIEEDKQRTGVHNGQYLGKAVRWVYCINLKNYIVDSNKFNMVAGSEGALPVMTLPDQMPRGLDFDKYIEIAQGMLKDLGVSK